MPVGNDPCRPYNLPNHRNSYIVRATLVPPDYASAAPARKQRSLWPLVMLPLLALLIIASSDLGEVSPHIIPLRPGAVVTGPVVSMPLTSSQINTLDHLSQYFSYKQLAQVYVSHMTLDEKLGQLFLLRSYDQFYSPSLEYAITQLHVGGVIMYAFQMQTFNQTKHDIAEMQQHASIPLMIATDEERLCQTVQNIFGTISGALEIYRDG